MRCTSSGVASVAKTVCFAGWGDVCMQYMFMASCRRDAFLFKPLLIALPRQREGRPDMQARDVRHAACGRALLEVRTARTVRGPARGGTPTRRSSPPPSGPWRAPTTKVNPPRQIPSEALGRRDDRSGKPPRCHRSDPAATASWMLLGRRAGAHRAPLSRPSGAIFAGRRSSRPRLRPPSHGGRPSGSPLGHSKSAHAATDTPMRRLRRCRCRRC